MDPLRRLGTIAAVLSAFGVSACATMQVGSIVGRGVDLRQYQTYGWATDESRATGDPRLDGNSFFRARVESAVEKALDERGFRKVTSEGPDVVLRYFTSVNQRVDANGLERGSTPPAGSVPFVYDAATLWVDVVDARSQMLVWRGWSESSFDGLVDNQMWLEQKVDEVVARILEQLPPRRAGGGPTSHAALLSSRPPL